MRGRSIFGTSGDVLNLQKYCESWRETVSCVKTALWLCAIYWHRKLNVVGVSRIIAWTEGDWYTSIVRRGWRGAHRWPVRRPAACSADRGRHWWCPARAAAPPPHCWCWVCLWERPRSGYRGCIALWRDAWWSWQTPWKDLRVITETRREVNLILMSGCGTYLILTLASSKLSDTK